MTDPSAAQIAKTVRDALDDLERQGGLDVDDVQRLVSRNGLRPADAVAVFEALSDQGIMVDDDDQLPIERKVAGLTDQLSQIVQRVRAYPLLTADEEVALGRRIQVGLDAQRETPEPPPGSIAAALIQDGRSAHQTLVLSNIRLVVSIARRHVREGLELSDLVQEGIFGLMRAADKFDPSLGYKFSTYATWWIRQAISRGVADRGRLIRLPVHVVEQVAKVRGVRGALERELQRPPTLLETAEKLEMEPGKVQAILDVSREPLSLDFTMPDSDTELSEVLNLYSADVEDEVATDIIRGDVDRALDLLAIALGRSAHGASAYGADMLRLRYGLDDGEPWTLDAIGDHYGVTRERVRQILNKTLKSRMLAAVFSSLDPKLERES